jgi:hypothetical protein
MTYECRVSVFYGNRLSRLERSRLANGEFDELLDRLNDSSALWTRSDKSRDERLLACVAVVTALVQFGTSVGMPLYAKDRANNVLVALNELMCGRRSVLLSPSPVHPSSFAVADLQQQAMAQVCVDYLRRAGLGAEEARTQVSGLFEKHKLPKFGVSKLRALNSRLRGRGSSQDEAYELYIWAQEHADRTAVELNIDPASSVTSAKKFADQLIGFAKRRDHRRDFFFAPDADSRPIP